MKEPIERETEYAVLAGMMNNKDCFYDAVSVLSEDFFTEDMTINLFKKLQESQHKGLTTAKMITKEFEDPKEKAHIRTIDGAYVDYEHFQRDLDKLKNVHLKRQLYFTINKAISRMDEKESKGEEIIAEIERDLSRVEYDDSNQNIIDPAERAVEGYNAFLERVSNPEKFKGIPFSYNTGNSIIGFPSLDNALNGAKGGDLIMLGAKTGEGKTALAVSIARLFSLKQSYHGYYQNTEMQIDEMEARLLAPLAKVTAKEILSGELLGNAKIKTNLVSDAYEVYRKSYLYLSRIPSLPLHKSKGLAKQLKNRYGKLDYLIVDYIGRMDLNNKDRNMQFWDVMYEIIKQLKELAMEMDIPIFVLAQRNQAGEVEGAKKMMNECDAVLFFEPVNDDDQQQIEQTYNNPDKRSKVNYKILKKKVRRDDNPYPIYCNFDKSLQFINEIPLF